MSALLCAFVLIASGTEVPAHVSYMLGTVRIVRGGTTYSAVLNASLYVGDVVKTGQDSECEIQFSNYSLVRLDQNSSITIERKEKTQQGVFHRIFASIGNIVTKVTELNKGDEYEVRTKAAQAFIRGTTFRTNVEEDGTSSFSVFEGTINVKSLLEGAQEIILDKNFKSIIKRGELAPVVDKLSDFEITTFAQQYDDFIKRGAVLDSLGQHIEEKIEDKKDDIKDKGIDKIKDIFK